MRMNDIKKFYNMINMRFSVVITSPQRDFVFIKY